MNIGFVNEYFPPFAPGGAEWSSLELARGLAQDHQVCVITPNYGAPDTELVDGVEVVRFPSPIQLTGPGNTVNMRWLANPGFYKRTAQAIIQNSSRKSFDILHVQAKYSLPGGYWAARRLGIPIILSIRDSFFVCPTGQCLMAFMPVHVQCGTLRFWWKTCRSLFLKSYFPQSRWYGRIDRALLWQQLNVRLFRFLLSRVEGVIGVSSGILDIHRQVGLDLGKQSTVIYNLPPQAPSPTLRQTTAVKQKLALKETPIILYAGKFSPGKGTQILIDAAELVHIRHPDAQFLFAGKGDIRLNGPHTRNLGQLPHKELQALYHVADLVVIPSTWPEPFSRVGLEAMSAGKPLIGTRVGGTPEQIRDGVTGILVPRKDPQLMATAVNKLLDDPQLRRNMGNAALEEIQSRFSAEASLRKTIQFYKHVIETRLSRI